MFELWRGGKGNGSSQIEGKIAENMSHYLLMKFFFIVERVMKKGLLSGTYNQVRFLKFIRASCEGGECPNIARLFGHEIVKD